MKEKVPCDPLGAFSHLRFSPRHIVIRHFRGDEPVSRLIGDDVADAESMPGFVMAEFGDGSCAEIRDEPKGFIQQSLLLLGEKIRGRFRGGMKAVLAEAEIILANDR